MCCRYSCGALGAALVLTLTGCARGPTRPAPTPIPGPLAGLTLYLDPGHGGADPGAVKGGVHEAALTYRLAATLAQAAASRGAHVVYTVESAALSPSSPSAPLVAPTDARLRFNGALLGRRASAADLYRRAAITRTPPPGTRRSVFLALHADALRRRAWWGARVYADPRRGAPGPIATRLKKALTRGGYTFSQGGIVIPRRYGVLNPTYNAADEALLLEFATLSNAEDRARAADPAWREQLTALILTVLEETQ